MGGSEMGNRFLVNVFRVGLAAILAYEVFRWKILKSSLAFSWQGLVLTALAAIIILEIASRWLRKKHSIEISWTSYVAAFVSLALDAAGDMFHWYTIYSPWFDRLLHFIGGAVVAIIVYDVLRGIHTANPNAFSWGWLSVLTVLGTLFWGFAYEWLEYAEDVFYWKRTVRLGDAYDTVDDMQLNLLGGAAIVFLFYFFRKKPHKHPPLS